MATLENSVLLDTTVVVRHFRNENAMVDKLKAYEDLYLPQAGLAELYAGAFRSARPDENIQKIKQFLEGVDVLAPNDSAPEIYGRISAQLALAGTPIPQNDIWIAVVAKQHNLPVATLDRHFQCVSGLSVLLW